MTWEQNTINHRVNLRIIVWDAPIKAYDCKTDRWKITFLAVNLIETIPIPLG